MADDNAIEQAAIARINSLFGRVEGASGKAATKLYDLATAGGAAQSSIGGFSTSMSQAAAGVYQAATSQKAAAKAASDAYRESASSVTSTIGSFSQNAMDKMANMLQNQEKGAGMLGGAFKGVGGSAKAGTEKLGKFAKMGGVAGLALKGLGTGLGVAGTAAGMLADYANDNLQKWESLTRSGIGLQGNYLALGESLKGTRLSLGQLAQHLDKNSQSLAKLGGIAGLGAEQLMAVQTSMQAFDKGFTGSGATFQQTLRGMGVDADESMGLISSMMGDEMAMRSFRNLSDQEQAESTMEYIQQLDKLSKLTGKSREELADSMAVANFDAQLEAAMDIQGIEGVQRKQIKMQLKHIEDVYGTDMRDNVQAAFAGTIPATKSAQLAMVGETGQLAMQTGQALRDTIMSGNGDVEGAFSGFIDGIGAAGRNQSQAFQYLAAAGVEEGKMMFGQAAQAAARDDALRDSAAKAVEGLTRLQASTMSLSVLIDKMVARDRGVTEPGEWRTGSPGTEATQSATRLDTQIRDAMLKFASYLASPSVLGSDFAINTQDFIQGGIQDVMSLFSDDRVVGANARRETGGVDFYDSQDTPAGPTIRAGKAAWEKVTGLWDRLNTEESTAKQQAYLDQTHALTGKDFRKWQGSELGVDTLVGGTGLAATESGRRNQLEAAQKAMVEHDENKRWKGLGKFFTGDEGQGLSMAERIEKAIEKQTTELKQTKQSDNVTTNPSSNVSQDATGHYLSGTGVQ